MITDVGIDLDGVLYDFADVFHEYCQNRMDKTLPRPTKWNFYEDWGLTETQFNEWLNEGVLKLRLFNCRAPMPNAVEGWNLLREMGIGIHVLTHRTHISYEQTVQWLNKYGLFPDTLHFGSHKHVLKQIADDECASVDDHIFYYEQYEKEGIISFIQTQPWNADAPARRVDDMLDFAHKVKAINESRMALTPTWKPKAKKPMVTEEPWKYPKIVNNYQFKKVIELDKTPHVNKEIWQWK